MLPRERRETGTQDLFRSRLDQIINMNHELVRLAKTVSWETIEARCGEVYSDGPGMPPLPTRLMAGLAILKHTFDLSDEELCARWVENSYFQFFCGEEFFLHELPFDRSSLTRWRQRMGEERIFVAAYPAETTEAFCDGHARAFAFFGGVPKSILYDNIRIAVARILGDGKRRRARVFAELQSHYLFEDRFGRPGKGNDKGKVEGLVGYARRNFLVPIPVFDSFEALNVHLMECCRR